MVAEKAADSAASAQQQGSAVRDYVAGKEGAAPAKSLPGLNQKSTNVGESEVEDTNALKPMGALPPPLHKVMPI